MTPIKAIVIAALALTAIGCGRPPPPATQRWRVTCTIDDKVVFDTDWKGSVRANGWNVPPYITDEGTLFYSDGAYKLPPGAACKSETRGGVVKP